MPPPSSDAELVTLIDRIAQRDETALRALYDLTSPRLFGLAMRVLRRRDAKAAPPACALRDDLPDPAGQRSHDRVVQRDLLASLLGRLAPAERRLLLMHYAQHMTFREIAEIGRAHV